METNRHSMNFCRYVPGPPLTQYVDWLWYYDDWQARPGQAHSREHVLPDGTFELIINLQGQPRKLFDRKDPARYHSFRRGWLSGTQTGCLVIDVLPGSSLVGAHFKPGGIAPFLRLPAGELGGLVVELDSIWGGEVWDWRERLLAAPSPQAKFRVLEMLLLVRLAVARASLNGEQRINWALARFLKEPHVQRISDIADALGVSHKHFIEEFRRRVGLTPKLFCRIRRFQQVLSQIQSRHAIEWADVAVSCGYFDQAHFVNDFQAFAGLNPTAYLNYRLEYPNFIRAAD